MVMTMLNFIDLSEHNGAVDFNKVKAAGIEGVILRMAYGQESPKQIDKRWEENYKKAKAAGLQVGAYHYSYALTGAEAAKEAEFALKLLQDKQLELPIFCDIEEEKHVRLERILCTSIVQTFCDALEKAGYWAGVYSFDSFFATNLTPYIQKRYTCWVASVEERKPKACTAWALWQYTWKSKIPGVVGDVDCNRCVKDFAPLIKAAGLNGFDNKGVDITAVKLNVPLYAAEAEAEKLKKEGYTVTMQ